MMRRQSIILTVRQDEMTGELGLCIPGVNPSDIVNASSDGLGIAHDLIEHMNGAHQIGGIADEMEALGALWFVRGATGQLRRDGMGSMYSPEKNLASDLARMFDDWHSHGQWLEPKYPKTRECDDDASLCAIIEHARDEIESNGNDCERDARKYPDAKRFYLAVALAFMRIGYRKAKKKYGNTDEANHLFWAVADAVAPHAKHCEVEGQEFKLVYGGDHPPYCMEHYSEEYNDE